jgi:hypothetical protein
MKSLFAFALIFLAGHAASAQSAYSYNDAGLPSSSVQKVHVNVLSAPADYCDRDDVRCFQVTIHLNDLSEPGMVCEARVGEKSQSVGYMDTPSLVNRSFDKDRLYKTHTVELLHTTLAYASFLLNGNGDSSGIGVWADPVNEDETRGGIDVPLNCAKQLQNWIKSALMSGGTADITTYDTVQ